MCRQILAVTLRGAGPAWDGGDGVGEGRLGVGLVRCLVGYFNFLMSVYCRYDVNVFMLVLS